MTVELLFTLHSSLILRRIAMLEDIQETLREQQLGVAEKILQSRGVRHQEVKS
jgi:hypothetical protein